MKRRLIAIVGRPNVGKSRLFNRLTESQQAIVHDYEGVTRDRQYGDNEWFGRHYTVIDTGGFVPESTEPMLSQMRDQAQLAIDEADVTIFMMDGRAGFTESDREIANMLRAADRPDAKSTKVFYAVNKVDSWERREEVLTDFYQLGVELYPVSAEHGNGLDALMDDVTADFPVLSYDEMTALQNVDDDITRVAVVGKPNAGKSSLINRMLGEERLLTSEVAGTTRDSIDTMMRRNGRDYLFIDTAGLRKKASITWRLEEFAVVAALRAIERADIAVLVIDGEAGITQQDKKIASVAARRGCACIVLVNKWDIVDKDGATAGEFVKEFRHQLPFLDWAPLLFVSAKTGQRVQKVFEMVDGAYDQFTRRIPTAELNRLLEVVLVQHSPPVHRNRRVKFYYTTQVATRPPTFAFIVNRPEGVAPSYRRYLENRIRQEYGFEGTPVRSLVRLRKGHERDT